MKKFAFFAFLFVTFSTVAYATDTYECDYTSYSDQKGNHKEGMKITFMVDPENGKSYVIGNNGSEEVLLVKNSNGLGFVEVTNSGNVMSTAISGDMNSVHSRNSIMGNNIIPSQYYGTCVKK